MFIYGCIKKTNYILLSTVRYKGMFYLRVTKIWKKPTLK